MIHVNELMIGNYLRINRDRLCIKKGTIVEVRVIDANNTFENHIGCATCRPLDDMQYEGGIWCDYLDPIPLTPEILEKNGFKKCNEDTDGAIQYEFGDENLGVDIWVNTEPCLFGAWRTWEGESQSYSMIDELPISFVHELQHALRLCGIEKEIKL